MEANGICGDGNPDAGEQCDDGNTVSGDGCNASRQSENPELCGNGSLDTGEQCDDGNTIDDGNGCSATCQLNAVTAISAVPGSSAANTISVNQADWFSF